MSGIPKVYDPKAAEEKWYGFWEKNKYFDAKVNFDEKPFSIVIPPPNVTGSLHMGHALNNTIQDLLIRRKRMQGYVAEWLPGTDHAGIATQNVVEKQLALEGLSRHDLGREKFVERVWAWKEEYGNTIIGQLKRLGCSCDWVRERFTMDQEYSRAVKKVFVNLYHDGLIYRGDRIINWCPRCRTALSDIEVEHEDVSGFLWYLDYPFEEGEGFVRVATTRPETMLGDTAVAVNPSDNRYGGIIGKKVLLPIVGRVIPVIADEFVDPSFGTGAVKVTPAHDPNDFEIGTRHGLEMPKILSEDGRVNLPQGRYHGMDRFEAREALIYDLKISGILSKTESHEHSVGHCYRCHTVIEPYLSLQWFVDMKSLAAPAIEVVRKGKIRFVPDRWKRVYFEWMEKIKDWCISRQIWWGHQIPAWYCKNCEEIVVEEETPESCPKCGGKLYQDSDVLDTWFSSALWPFATHGWPDETDELSYFYPTSVLSTARDILYLWVARMIMTGLRFGNDIPFETVIIHPTVLNFEGRRMSKSLGTGVDPLELIEKYGTDAVRFGLMVQTSQMQDLRFSKEKIEMSRNFCNKLWNASRFILMNAGEALPVCSRKNLEDRWIFSRYSSLVTKVNDLFEKFDFGEAARQIYSFVWSEFCDWYLEISKIHINSKVEEESDSTKRNLVYLLDGVLKLLHPMMPFITEEIWQKLPKNRGEAKSIMISQYPGDETATMTDPEAEEALAVLMGAITSIRAVRSELALSPVTTLPAKVICSDSSKLELLKEHGTYLKTLARLGQIEFAGQAVAPKKSATAVFGDIQVFLLLEGLVDIEEEIKRLDKEIVKVSKEIELRNEKLAGEFSVRAPADIVERERDKLRELRSLLTKFELQKSHLKG